MLLPFIALPVFSAVILVFIAFTHEVTARSAPASVCNPNPCLYGGICQMTSATDYECTGCHQLTSGKNCEKLSCGYTNCFASNGTLYLAFESESWWEEANRKCINNGMRLAMPKDAAAHDFLSQQLSLVYGRNEDIGGWWMGLRRDANGWRWLDGSRLGAYVGGSGQLDFSVDTSDLYVVLSPSPNSSLLQWNPIQNGVYYPICEKRSVRFLNFA